MMIWMAAVVLASVIRWRREQKQWLQLGQLVEAVGEALARPGEPAGPAPGGGRRRTA